MLKITWSSKNLLLFINVAEHNEVGTVGGAGDHEDETVKRSLSNNSNRATSYLTPIARLVFTKLRKVFTKAPILWHSDPEYHIQIETDVSGYAIDEV